MSSEEMSKHYQAVLNDLEQRRQSCQKELAELEQAIAFMRKPIPLQTLNVYPGKYSDMSVRWAILNLLAEDAVAPMPTSDIAEALQQGGISSRGKSFNSNVSAVLSQMTREREETEQIGSGYRISEHGRAVWEGIKNTEQYRTRQIHGDPEQEYAC